MAPWRTGRWALLAVIALVVPAYTLGQAPPQGEPVSAQAVRQAIDRLSSLEFPVRMDAARTVRRATAAVAISALLQAIEEHADGWVRYKSLILLVGFNDPRARDLMLRFLDDPNDRLRGAAYRYFEHNPDPVLAPRLLDALAREQSEFVRPALIRAVAALGADARARDTLIVEIDRGEDFFRSTVIEALGDYRGQYAVPALVRIARQEGPLQDDAVMALGKLGDRRALETLALLQRSAPRESQPAIAAAICLLGVNCSAHLGYITDTVRFAVEQPGFQPLLRSATAGLAALGSTGNGDAVNLLLDVGIPSRDPARAPIALALGTIAMRNTPFMVATLAKRTDLQDATLLLRDAFDMLEEDFEEEQFYAAVRRMYWQAEGESPTRRVAEALIGTLEF